MSDKESEFRSRMVIFGWSVDGQIHRECDVKEWRLLRKPDDGNLGFIGPTIFVFSCGEKAKVLDLVRNDWRAPICERCFPDNESRHWQITTDVPTWGPALFTELVQAARWADKLAEKYPKIGCTFYVNSGPIPTKQNTPIATPDA